MSNSKTDLNISIKLEEIKNLNDINNSILIWNIDHDTSKLEGIIDPNLTTYSPSQRGIKSLCKMT